MSSSFKSASRRLFVQSLTGSTKFVESENFLEPKRIDSEKKIMEDEINSKEAKTDTVEKDLAELQRKYHALKSRRNLEDDVPTWAKLVLASSKPNLPRKSDVNYFFKK